MVDHEPEALRVAQSLAAYADLTTTEELRAALTAASASLAAGDDSTVFATLTFGGTTLYPRFEPNRFRPDRDTHGIEIGEFFRCAITEEAHVVAALEYACDDAPSVVLDAARGRGALLLGGYKCVSKQVIKAHGVTHIVTAARGLGSFFTKFPKRCAKLEAKRGVQFKCLDWNDALDQHIDLDELAAAVRWIDAALVGGGAVLVHCAQGKSRSTTVVVAYLRAVAACGADADLASCLAFVKSRRMMAQPNRHFWAQLKAVEDDGGFERMMCEEELQERPPCLLEERPHADLVVDEDWNAGLVESSSRSDDDAPLGRIYIGALSAARDTAALEARGITAVLTVAARLKVYGTSAHLATKPDTIKHRRVKLDDHPCASLLDTLRKSFKFLDKHCSGADAAVLVHCASGVSRSVGTVVAYLMVRNGCTVDEALRCVRVGRPLGNPNVGFRMQLDALETCGNDVEQARELCAASLAASSQTMAEALVEQRGAANAAHARADAVEDALRTLQATAAETRAAAGDEAAALKALEWQRELRSVLEYVASLAPADDAVIIDRPARMIANSAGRKAEQLLAEVEALCAVQPALAPPAGAAFGPG